MSSIAQQPGPRRVAIGVDTHKYIHVAVALDELGGRLGELTVPADSGGYAQLERWAVEQGRRPRLRDRGHGVVRRRRHELPPAARPPGDRGQPARPAGATDERQERCARRRERGPRGPVRPGHGHAQGGRRPDRDAPPDQDRQGHRGEGADPGDRDAQDARRHRTARSSASSSTASRRWPSSSAAPDSAPGR